MQFGAIPVIVDWQANALASLFNGLLFESMDRFEDVFVILDWRSAHEHPEYILERLTDIVVSGMGVMAEYAKETCATLSTLSRQPCQISN
jgi:hypothetical protein